MCFGTYHFFIALPAPPDIFVPKHVVDHQPKKRSRPISKKDLHDQHESLVACHAALVARHAALVDALVTSKGLFCPITQEAIVEPVVAADGHTYERLAIVRWLSDHHTSPVTGLFMRLELFSFLFFFSSLNCFLSPSLSHLLTYGSNEQMNN